MNWQSNMVWNHFWKQINSFFLFFIIVCVSLLVSIANLKFETNWSAISISIYYLKMETDRNCIRVFRYRCRKKLICPISCDIFSLDECFKYINDKHATAIFQYNNNWFESHIWHCVINILIAWMNCWKIEYNSYSFVVFVFSSLFFNFYLVSALQCLFLFFAQSRTQCIPNRLKIRDNIPTENDEKPKSMQICWKKWKVFMWKNGMMSFDKIFEFLQQQKTPIRQITTENRISKNS